MYTNNHFSFIKSQCIENENILELVTIVMTAINSVSYNQLMTQVKTFLKLEYIPRLLDIHIIILVKKIRWFWEFGFWFVVFYSVLWCFSPIYILAVTVNNGSSNRSSIIDGSGINEIVPVGHMDPIDGSMSQNYDLPPPPEVLTNNNFDGQSLSSNSVTVRGSLSL